MGRQHNVFAVFSLICAYLFSSVQCKKLRLPIHGVRVQQDVASILSKRFHQIPPGSPVSQYQTALYPDAPLYESGLNLLTTKLSIGTPPQTFTVILSLFSRDLFVLSCMSPEKEFENHNHYNSSLSSTHVFNETRIQIPFLNALGSGLTSQDHITIGVVTVADQLFAEVYMVRHGWSTGEVYWDGVLGLGATKGNSSMGTENLATAMWKQGLIEKNVFELTIPRNEADIGQLILGGMSDDVGEDEVKWIPVSNKTVVIADEVRSGWIVAASSVMVGDGTKVNNTVRSNATAWIETEMPFLMLPDTMVDEIHRLIRARQIGWSPFYSVNKKERRSFPELMFKLGGEEVRITGYDYTICDGSDCISLLMGIYGNDELVVLGGGFLRGVRSVFDLENDRVGFSELNTRA